MAVVETETHGSGCYLGQSASLNIINEEIKIPAGNGVLRPGRILAQVTGAPANTYVPHNPGATNGSQNAKAILFHRVDTADGEVKTVGTVRGPATVNGNMLLFSDGISDANRATAIQALRDRGLAILPQHAA